MDAVLNNRYQLLDELGQGGTGTATAPTIVQ
jgi:hypothetical protein